MKKVANLPPLLITSGSPLKRRTVLHPIWMFSTYLRKLPVEDVNATLGPGLAQVNVVSVGVPVTITSSLNEASLSPSTVAWYPTSIWCALFVVYVATPAVRWNPMGWISQGKSTGLSIPRRPPVVLSFTPGFKTVKVVVVGVAITVNFPMKLPMMVFRTVTLKPG